MIWSSGLHFPWAPGKIIRHWLRLGFHRVPRWTWWSNPRWWACRVVGWHHLFLEGLTNPDKLKKLREQSKAKNLWVESQSRLPSKLDIHLASSHQSDDSVPIEDYMSRWCNIIHQPSPNAQIPPSPTLVSGEHEAFSRSVGVYPPSSPRYTQRRLIVGRDSPGSEHDGARNTKI